MVASNFAPSLKRVLVHEGGYSNHKEDNGGATMKGVIQRVYDAYRTNLGRVRQSVRLITEDELQDIYRRQYWNAIRGDELPVGIDYVVFDGAVNSGPKQSLKWLQKALAQKGYYKAKIDGVWGEATRAALKMASNHDELVDLICDIRMKFLRALSDWKHFGKGWQSRVSGVRVAGKNMAVGMFTTPPALVDISVNPETPKATIDNAIKRPTKAVADAAVGTGAGIAGAAQAVQQAIEQLAPLAAAGGSVTTIVTYLTLGGVFLALGGIAMRVFQKSKEAQRADDLNLTDGT